MTETVQITIYVIQFSRELEFKMSVVKSIALQMQCADC